MVVSNRVSVPDDGAKRAGGLEVALRPALEHNGGVWLGWSGKVAPVEQLITRRFRDRNVEYVATDLSKHDFEEYYNGFANRVLWPILHYRLISPSSHDATSVAISRQHHFADESTRSWRTTTSSGLHDYHLIPVADALRRRGHANRIGFFLHVPFPSPEVYDVDAQARAADSPVAAVRCVGFQTENDPEFRPLSDFRIPAGSLAYSRHLGGNITLSMDGQHTRIGNFPVGIEPRVFRAWPAAMCRLAW